MRVVAARFSAPEMATAVLETLRDRLHVPRPDAAIAPLGHPGYAASNEALLAGRFTDDQTGSVVELIQRGGGELVANIDERLTRSQPPRGTTATWPREHAQAS